MQYLGAVSNTISVRFLGKPFNITVIQVYTPTTNAKEAEVEPFYEDLLKNDVLFSLGNWNAKVVTGLE